MKNWINFVEEHPHEFTIQYPPRREYFKEFFSTEHKKHLFDQEKEVLLYVHIPFCEAKCYYCNFAVDVRNRTEVYEKYTQTILSELTNLHHLLDQGIVFNGIDIGGGTPTRLPLHLLEKILVGLTPFIKTSSHDFPLSIETTPNIASESQTLLHSLTHHSVDRISMGIQSFNEENLKDVNRKIHVNKNRIATQNIRDAGFKRFNTDLIFGLPQQSLKNWEYDIDQIIDLSPDSITTYDCLYRGKGRALTKKTKYIPSLDTYGKLYDLAYQKLTSVGYYAPYGSVNFSKNKLETGTSAYFEGRLLDGLPYIGVGNYSSSQVNNYWLFNSYDVNSHINKIKNENESISDIYLLSNAEIYAKYLLYSLNFGIIDVTKFKLRFNIDFNSFYSEELSFATQNKWLVQDENIWKIVDGNFKNMNLIRSLFYSKKAQQWLSNLYQD